MAEAIVLPCCFALKSKRHESYVRYVHEERDETTYGQLQLNGEDAVNPFTRFDSEPSMLHQGLVHIRCRYNRKYWVPRQHAAGWWIAADAHDSEEDIDSPNCTLIKPIISVVDADADANDDDATTGAVMTVSFLHAGRGKDTRMTFSMDGGTAACMRILGSDDHGDNCDAFTVLNMSSSPRRLPRLVVFKGDNNLYLSSVAMGGRNYLQFSARDPGEPAVAHEITYPGNGRLMRVRNIHHDMMWGFRRTDSEWVLANIGPKSNPPANTISSFHVVDVRDYIAIRTTSALTSPILKRMTRGTITNCLNAGNTSRGITADARIRVEEPVLDRQIYNVEYRLREVAIYDTSLLTMATTAAVNDTSKENIKKLTLAYEESELSTWDATLELKLGYNSRLRAGFPKLGLGATVEISADFFGAYNWGQTMEKKVSHEVEYEVTVPPKTKVTVRLIATRSAMNLPFSYWQRDIMSTDGKPRVLQMHDGRYTGVNSYNFKFETTEEKVEARLLAPTPP